MNHLFRGGQGTPRRKTGPRKAQPVVCDPQPASGERPWNPLFHTVAAWFCRRSGAMIAGSQAWSGRLQPASSADRERPEMRKECSERRERQR